MCLPHIMHVQGEEDEHVAMQSAEQLRIRMMDVACSLGIILKIGFYKNPSIACGIIASLRHGDTIQVCMLPLAHACHRSTSLPDPPISDGRCAIHKAGTEGYNCTLYTGIIPVYESPLRSGVALAPENLYSAPLSIVTAIPVFLNFAWHACALFQST